MNISSRSDDTNPLSRDPDQRKVGFGEIRSWDLIAFPLFREVVYIHSGMSQHPAGGTLLSKLVDSDKIRTSSRSDLVGSWNQSIAPEDSNPTHLQPGL